MDDEGLELGTNVGVGDGTSEVVGM